MNRKFWWCLVLVLMPPAAMADYVMDRDVPKWFKETFYEFPADVEEATAEGKRLMVYFGQDGCPYCEKLHHEVFDNEAMKDKLQRHFDSIAVNMFGDVETEWMDGTVLTQKDLAKKLDIQFTPSLVFLDEAGEVILKIAGYQPPKKFNAILDYVALKHEKQQGFAEYWRGQRDGKNAVAVPYPDTFVAPPFSTPAGGADKKTAVLVVQGVCLYCEEWQAFLSGEQSAAWHKEFNLIQVDAYSDQAVFADGSSGREWVDNADVSFIPALLFYDSEGNEIMRVDGYLRAFHLSSVLDYIASDAYLTEKEFQRFLQQRADSLREQGEEVTIW